MATPAKRASPSKPERPVKPVKPIKAIKASESTKPVKPSAAADVDAEPILRFRHPVALRKKTLSLLGTLEQADDVIVYRDGRPALAAQRETRGPDA